MYLFAHTNVLATGKLDVRPKYMPHTGKKQLAKRAKTLSCKGETHLAPLHTHTQG